MRQATAGLVWLLLGVCPPAFAVDPALDVSQYVHTAWRVRDGFSKGGINAIAQTPDGYLWLGTDFGLLRFDGVRNVPWEPPSRRLPSSQILSLLAGRDGTLWIGTSKGLVGWRNGLLAEYPQLSGHFTFALLEDSEGSVWASAWAVPTGKLCVVRKAGIQCHGEDGRFGRGAFQLFEDGKGRLWAGVVGGVWRLAPDSPKFYSVPDVPGAITSLGEDDDGALLVGGTGGLRRILDGRSEPYPAWRSRDIGVHQVFRDHRGGLWLGTFSGLVHVHQGRTDVFARRDGLSGDQLTSFFEDREGSVWAATSDGLDRFRDPAVVSFSVEQGLPHAGVGAVLAARDGSVWLGTAGGLGRWSEGRITTPRTSADRVDSKVDGLVPHALFEDGRGRIWISNRRGVGYLEGERFIYRKDIPGGTVRSFAEDSAGTLWVANQDLGLLRVPTGGPVERIEWPRLGHADLATTMTSDPVRGGLWLGFFKGGLVHFAEGEVRASYGAADGLATGYVSSLRLDAEGTLWVAAEGGLSRMKNGRFASLTTRSGLPCDGVQWSMEDDSRALWLYTSCGLVRIARPEVERWAAGVDRGSIDSEKESALDVAVFDLVDGVRTHSAATGFYPLVARSRDGRLWFLPFDGVSVVDPRRLPFNRLPPPVHIEQVIVDRRPLDASSVSSRPLRLPPAIRDLEIDYTALSFVAPERVRFRYKLEGRDRDWQDAGTRRQAFYGDLPPRDYRFRVIAANDSGVWNETGASLDFSIAPAYYQTAWFRLACIAALLAALAALHRLRLRQVAEHVRVRMEGRVEERERIARDLHDTLLQSVQGLILEFHAAIRRLPPDEPVRPVLEAGLDRADEVLAEGRDRVSDLRASADSIADLPTAFQRLCDEAAAGREVTFKIVVEGTARALHPVVLEESYAIGREGVVNALTHSGGREVEVEIAYDARQFRLRVRDDGRGIDPGVLEEGGRPGHWGLQGMRERAERIGGRLQLWNRPGSGTEVELAVPAATAYLDLRSRSPVAWLRRLVRIDGSRS